MIIYVNRLGSDNEGRLSFDLAQEMGPIDYRGETICFASPVKVKGYVKQDKDVYLVIGQVQTEVLLECSRCLEIVNYPVHTEFEQQYSASGSQEETLMMDGDRIDLDKPVVESILLELPIKIVCSEECKGLCPICGSNRNINECKCSDEEIDPRMMVLKKLLKDK